MFIQTGDPKENLEQKLKLKKALENMELAVSIKSQKFKYDNNTALNEYDDGYDYADDFEK